MKKDSATKNLKEENKKELDESSTSKFLEKLDFTHTSSREVEDNKTKDFKSVDEGEERDFQGSDEEVKDGSRSVDEGEEHDPHAFPMISDFFDVERVKIIIFAKDKILIGIGILAGILLVIFGVMMTMDSVDRIADNVIFGEREVFSVFLILVGVLLIACSLAYKFLGKSFFKQIDNNVESYDKVSSDSTKNNIKKDNINRNNR